MSRWRSLLVNCGLRFIRVIDRNGCERRILRRRAFRAHLHGSRAATVATSPHATIFMQSCSSWKRRGCLQIIRDAAEEKTDLGTRKVWRAK